MGKCKYCGQNAGFFSHAHKECEEKHKQGFAELLAYLNAYFNGTSSISSVLSKIKTLQTDNYLSQEDIENCCSQAIKHYADIVRHAQPYQVLSILQTLFAHWI